MGAKAAFVPGVIALMLCILPARTGADDLKPKRAAQRSQLRPSASGDAGALRLNADVLRTMTAYQESLEKLRAVYEEDFRKRAEAVVERSGLYAKGYISRSELEEAQRSMAEAEARIKEIEAKIVEARIGIAEAAARAGVLKLPPARSGEYKETATWIRYNGGRKWSLAEASKIEKFFTRRFGRPLPVSAFGQTAFHDRMRLDHRDAIDVGVHPDSPEGRVLMDYLRRAGIPFMAFRTKALGSASGAHIHIGGPSVRIIY